MSVIRCVVMGDRDVVDEEFVRTAMLRFWRESTDNGSNGNRVQFVIPSEVGYNRIELPVRGVARTAYNILHNARQQGKKNASILMPILAPVDWNRVEYRDTAHHHFHHEVIDSRKVAPTDIWNSEVLDEGVWAEYILSQSSSAEPEFLVAPSHVIAIEGASPYGWVQNMLAVARNVGVAVTRYSVREFATLSLRQRGAVA
jgi:hypothetical protein